MISPGIAGRFFTFFYLFVFSFRLLAQDNLSNRDYQVQKMDTNSIAELDEFLPWQDELEFYNKYKVRCISRISIFIIKKHEYFQCLHTN